jgi:hypothetical protein
MSSGEVEGTMAKITPLGFIEAQIFDVKKNRTVGRRKAKNLITSQGLNMLSNALIGPLSNTYSLIRYANVGTSAAAVAMSQSYLLAPVSSGGRVGASVEGGIGVAYQGAAQLNSSDPWWGVVGGFSGLQVMFGWSYNTNEFPGSAIQEAGLAMALGTCAYGAPVANVKYISRLTFPQTTKTTDMQMFFTYYVQFHT